MVFMMCLLTVCSLFGLATGMAQSLPDSLPDLQGYRIDILTPDDVIEYSYTTSMRIDRDLAQITIAATGPSYQSKSVYDLSFLLLSSELEVRAKDDIERIGFDRRTAFIDIEVDRLVLEFFLEQESQQIREHDIPTETVDIESLGLYLQSLVLAGETTFHGNLYDSNSGDKFNRLQVSLLKQSEIDKLVRQSTFPETMNVMLKDSDNIIVFSLGLRGLIRIFFPHRFYVVLEKQAPHHILGFWGGSSQRLRYHVYQKL